MKDLRIYVAVFDISGESKQQKHIKTLKFNLEGHRNKWDDNKVLESIDYCTRSEVKQIRKDQLLEPVTPKGE